MTSTKEHDETESPPLDPPEETKLLELARHGDREAFRQIVERHQADVFYLAIGLLHNRDDAEDVVQEVFVKAWKALERFRGDAGIGTWLYRVTLNACRDHQRRRRWLTLQESLGLVPDPESRWVEERPDADPERVAAGSEVRQDVMRALERLTPAERSVFVLRQFQQLSIKETAEVLDRAEGTVKNLLFRALRKLQKELAVHRRLEEVS